ncbi:MAG: DUF1232 domain-containing protein [Candidatus Woesearchaeota archaeon]
MERTFIDYLRDELEFAKDSGKEFDRELSHFPDIVKLLCDMLDNDIVDKQSRLMITSVLGYLLVPNDVLPEEVYGPYGYMDDMYVACIILNDLKKKYPDLTTYLWTHNDNLDMVLDVCTYKSGKFLDDKNLKDKLLRYCGLSG